MKTMMQIVMVVILLCCPAALAQTAGMLSFQGLLKDANGVPVSGSVTLQFRIYDAQTGGNLVDMDGDGQTYPTVPGEGDVGQDVKEVSTTATNGIVSTKFGPVSPKAFNGNARWLEIRVNGSPLSRTEVAGAAMIGEQLNVPGSGSAAVVVADNGFVGLNTSMPSQMLDVNGTVQSKFSNVLKPNGEPAIELKGTEQGYEVGVVRLYNTTGKNVAVLGGFEDYGAITLRDGRDGRERATVILKAFETGASDGGADLQLCNDQGLATIELDAQNVPTERGGSLIIRDGTGTPVFYLEANRNASAVFSWSVS